MMPDRFPLLAAWMLLGAACVVSQEPFDVLAHDGQLHLRLSLYNPQVPPQIVCLRSREEAQRFARLAFGEDKKELDLDYLHEQVLVVAWGAHRWDPVNHGGRLELGLDQAVVEDDMLRVVARTMIPPGRGGEVGDDQPGLTWYPSVFLRTPRTERVRVDVVGARCKDRSKDFQPVATRELEVRVFPDAAPSRELLQPVPLAPAYGAKAPQLWKQPRVPVAEDPSAELRLGAKPAAEGPRIALVERPEGQVLEVAWGELEAGLYRLDLTEALVRDGVARLTIRAEQQRIMFYSGPGVEYPRLAVTLPGVRKVLLHVERVGAPLGKGDQDFSSQQSERLVVTVDRSRVR